MANHASAKKRIRQTLKRNARNNARRSRLRNFIRKVREAVNSSDRAQAQAHFQAAMAELHRAAGKGLIKKNTAARKISRLNAAVKAMASQS